MAYKHVSFMVPQGGQLVSGSSSGDSAGAANYTEKLNFRRETDGEVRREGWGKMTVSGTEVSQLDSSGYPVRLLHQFMSEDTHVLVAAAGDRLFRFNESTLAWDVIASGLQSIDIEPASGVPPAVRWEAVSIDGYVIFNNGVDLPLFYREDWPCAFPMYSLRERGIIRCGTISEFDGRLWIADIVYMKDALFDDLMRELPQPYGVPEAQGSTHMASGSYRVPHTIEYSAWRLVDDISEARAAPYLFNQVYDGTLIVAGKASSVSMTSQGEGYDSATTTVSITDPTDSSSHERYNPEFATTDSVTATAVIEDTVDPASIAAEQTATVFTLNSPIVELATRKLCTVTTKSNTNVDSGKLLTITGEDENGTAVTDVITVPTGAATVTGTQYFLKISSVELSAMNAVAFSVGTKTEGAITGVDLSSDSTSGFRSAEIVISGNGTGASAVVNLNASLKGIELPFPISSKGSLNPYATPTWTDAAKMSEPNAVRPGDTIIIPLEDTTADIDTGDSITVDPTTKKTTIKCQVLQANTPNTDGESAQFILSKEPDAMSSDALAQQEASDTMSFPEDGSKMLKMAKLADKLMIYRQTGYLAVSRGNTQNAFFFEERYRGERVADFRNSIISISEQRQMFAGYNGVFIVTPSSVEPEPFQAMMTGPEFWRQVTKDESEHVYAVDNGLTHEAMIVAPIGLRDQGSVRVLDWGVLALDMMYGTLSTIDSTFTAATTIFPTDKIKSRWFLLATHIVADPTASSGTYVDSEPQAGGAPLGSCVMRYGYGPAEEGHGPYRIFTRAGGDYVSRLKFGKTDFGNRFSEKNLRSYLIHLSDAVPEEGYSSYLSSSYVEGDYLVNATATINLSTYSAAPDVAIEEVSEVMDKLGTQNMIPLFARGNYYQDTITFSASESAFKFTGRTFEVSGVQTRHVSEAVQVVEVVDA